MKRREFVTLLGSAVVAWPLAARAQQRPQRLDFWGPASASAMSAWTAAFVQRLRRDRISLGGGTQREASRNRGPQLRMIRNSGPASRYSRKYSLSSRGQRPT